MVGVVGLVGSVLLFLSGLGGRPLGILWTALVLATVTATMAAASFRSRQHTRAVVSVVVVVGLVAGAGVGVRTPPGPVALGRALDRLALPSSAEVVATSSSGNVLCFDVCPTARRTVRLPVPAEQAVRIVRDALRDAGYEVEPPVDVRSFHTAITDEREWYVAGRVESADHGSLLEIRAVASG